MYYCYICAAQSLSVSAFRSHLQTHLVLGDLTCPIKCRQGNCKSTFNKLCNFICHLLQFHAVDHTVTTGANAQADTSEVDDCAYNGIESENDLPVVHRLRDRNHVENLQQEAVSMVASLRANSSVPYSVVPEVVQSVDSMICTTVDYFQSETVKLLRESGVSDEI